MINFKNALETVRALNDRESTQSQLYKVLAITEDVIFIIFCIKRNGGKISATELASSTQFQMTLRTKYRCIKKLITLGLIKKEGVAYNTTYILLDKSKKFMEEYRIFEICLENFVKNFLSSS